jgi:hypothetical protein
MTDFERLKISLISCFGRMALQFPGALIRPVKTQNPIQISL